MQTLYNIIFSGKLKPDANFEEVVKKMLAISKSPENKIRDLLSSGNSVILKQGVRKDEAEPFYRKLDAIGMEMKVKKVVAAPPSATPQPDITEVTPTIKKEENLTTPRPQKVSPVTAQPNPYAAPKAKLTVKAEKQTTFLSEPRKVQAGHGWKWIMEGIRLLRASFWKWIGMYFVLILLLVPLSLIPIIGNVLNSIIGVVFGGGLMIGAHSLSEGKGLRFGHLFSGFTQNRNQLMLVGLYYIIGMIVASLVAFFPLGTTLLSAFWGSAGGDPEAIGMAMTQNLPLFLLCILLGAALSIPLVMSLWFAPSLVAIADQNGFTALKLSFRACLRNTVPYLVYTLGFLLFGIIFGIVFSILSGLIAFFAGNGSSVIFVALIPMLGLFFIGVPFMVVMGLSIYASFRDIFIKS